MTNFGKLFAISALAMGVFATGCSDDDGGTTPTPTTQYYTLASGDYSVYNRTELDTNSQPVAGSTIRDSAAIESSATYQGKPAFRQEKYRNGSAYDTTYISTENNTTMWYGNPLEIEGGIPVNVSARWNKIADFNSGVTSWKNFDTTNATFNVEYAGQTVPVTATISQNVTKGSMSAVTYGSGTSVQAQEFTVTTSVVGTVLGLFPVTFNNVEKFYFAKDIGLVQHHRDSYKVTVGANSVPILGFHTLLQAHNHTH